MCPRHGKGYGCYYCHAHFSTATKLQAHLITQEHICIVLPMAYAREIEKMKTEIMEENKNNNCMSDEHSHLKQTKLNSQGQLVKQEKYSITKKNTLFRKVLLPYTRCMYCGGTSNARESGRHMCSESVSYLSN